jgi:dTDP-L-rhamnose 4-epimerase
MEGERAAGRAVNVGRGEPRTILMVAEALAEMLGAAIRPFVSECFRDVDIRHCYADIGAARELLGWSPERGLSDGLRELVDWAREE